MQVSRLKSYPSVAISHFNSTALYFFKAHFYILLPTLTFHLMTQNANPKTICFFFFIGALSIISGKQVFGRSHELNQMKLSGDWTLILALSFHCVYSILIVVEFLYFDSSRQSLSVGTTITGIALLIASSILRIISKRHLGAQWSIHAIGPQRIKEISVATTGPYRFVRHPIYISWIADSLAVPLIWSCFYSLLFAIIFLAPIYVVRAALEEKASARRFKVPYLRYMLSVNAFFPSNVFDNKLIKKHINR